LGSILEHSRSTADEKETACLAVVEKAGAAASTLHQSGCCSRGFCLLCLPHHPHPSVSAPLLLALVAFWERTPARARSSFRAFFFVVFFFVFVVVVVVPALRCASRRV
tara:strand:- start:202 stop:525 length:324 start_codon:yes stop_codon:yes gene_type:complete